MKQIFENMIIILLILLSIMIHSTMIAGNLTITEARNFHASAVAEIQASNFDEEVIKEEKESAEQAGWELEVKTDTSIYSDRTAYKVTLTYNFPTLPLVGDSKDKQIIAYAY